MSIVNLTIPTVPGIKNTSIIQVPSANPPAKDQLSSLPIPVSGSVKFAQPIIAPTPQKANIPTPMVNTLPKVTLNIQRPNNPVFVPSPTQPVVEELKLREYQVDWAARAEEILYQRNGYIDTSLMGAGKTIIPIYLAKKFGLSIITICPVNVVPVWQKTCAKYSVKLVTALSYQELRSVKGAQPKHGLLNRQDNLSGRGLNKLSFSPTQAYFDLLARGVLLIFDEFQNIKNNSSQYKACSTLLHTLLQTGGTSRYGLLSATPIDKEEQAINLLRLIGYITSQRLYSIDRYSKSIILEGAQEAIDIAMSMDPEATRAIVDEFTMNKALVKRIPFELYTTVIKRFISGAMPAPTTIEGENDIKNGFFNITGNNAALLTDAVGQLATAVNYQRETNSAELTQNNVGAVTKALVMIENAKAFDMARIATKILMSVPNSKVIISVNYTGTITELQDLLSPYHPLILAGSIARKKRTQAVDSFNTDPKHRVLIMNTAVGGVGISLHDTVGDSPRYMLISPSYKIQNDVQATHRHRRDGTKSKTTTRMFYGNNDVGIETRILTALATKSIVMERSINTETNKDLILPVHYPSERENDPNQTLIPITI